MRINKIKVENIRSYVSQEIIFPEGKVLLWGNIGSGKSSILHAIDFALFGLQRSELAGASLLRNGTNEGTVELFFSLDDKDYILKRALKRSKLGVTQDAGHIIRNGIKEEKTAIELKQIVLELLHYPKDLITKNKTLIYRYTVYTPQEEMKTILLGSKEERLDTLRKVFGVDKYKRIKENVKIIVSDMKEKKKLYEGATADIQEKIVEREKKSQEKMIFEKKLKEVIIPLEELNKIVQKKKEELILLEGKREEILKEKRELSLWDLECKHKIKEKEETEDRIVILQQEITFLETENLDIIDVKDILRRANEQLLVKEKDLKEIIQSKKEELLLIEAQREKNLQIKRDLALWDLECKHKIKEKEETEDRIVILQQEITFLETENLEIIDVKDILRRANEQIMTQEKELREILNKIQDCKTRKAHALLIKQKVESLDNCPTCQQKVSLEHKHNILEKTNTETQNHDRERKSLEAIQQGKEEEIKKLHAEIEILRKKESEVAIIEMKRQQLLKKREETFGLLEKLALNKKAITKLNTKILEALIKQKDTETQNHDNEIALLEKNQQSKEEEIRNLRGEIDILRKKETEHAIIVMKKQQLLKKRGETFELMEKFTLNKRVIDELNTKISEAKEKQKDTETLELLYTANKQEAEQLQNKYHTLNLEKATITATVNYYIQSLNQLSEEIQKKQTLREKKEYINKIQFWLTDSFTPLLDTMEKNILFKVHAEFNSLFEKWFSILIDNQSLQMSLDEDYSPKIQQNDYDIEYEYLSGGEKTAGALAYRLALNQVINNMNTGIKTNDLLILDEPTDGFSHEQLDRLKILMEEINIPQIILVSHEAQIECFADHILRFEKQNHITRLVS